MQTSFTLDQLADPQTAEADKILRACVHCGFCTATCPTYVLLGDELDSPRGRIASCARCSRAFCLIRVCFVGLRLPACWESRSRRL
jgi:ferredoxin